MSQDVLVQVIFVLCNGMNTRDGGVLSQVNMYETKEARIECFEKYTNCAVLSDGKIMNLKEFTNKCLKK